jgi:hypothetical protein
MNLNKNSRFCCYRRAWIISNTNRLMAFEILDGLLMLLGFFAGFESSQITAAAGFGICFSRVKPVFARLQFFDHGLPPVGAGARGLPGRLLALPRGFFLGGFPRVAR